MANPCEKVRLCKDCIHADKDYDDGFLVRLICRRMQTKKCNPVYGSISYDGEYFDCGCERQFTGKSFKERIFGERKDKCGTEGKYWECKDSVNID